MAAPYVVFLSGASGAGKSTLVKALSEKYSDFSKAAFLHFDSIGVPLVEEMIKAYGSGKEWQKITTYEWIKRIAQDYKDKTIVFIEGQTELTFIKEAFKQYNIDHYVILLVNVCPEERHSRLIMYRDQADLINDDMDNWANYLLNKAISEGCDVINTSQNVESSVAFLETFFPK